MRQVLCALRLDHVGVLAVCLQKNVLQRVHFGQVRHGFARVGVGKPQPVRHAKARMAVQRQAEGAPQQLGLHHAAQCLALGLHGVAQAAPVPGQAAAQALAAHQKRHPVPGVHRGIAHQVDAARVGPRGGPHAAGVDDGHEHQAYPFQQVLQGAVPRQAVQHALQEGNHHLRTNALQPVHATKKACRRGAGVGAAHADGVHRKRGRLRQCHVADLLHMQVLRVLGQQTFEFIQFRQMAGQHGGGGAGGVRCQGVAAAQHSAAACAGKACVVGVRRAGGMSRCCHTGALRWRFPSP